MSVLSCHRKNCPNILCDKYSSIFGYICNECFTEMCSAQKNDELFTIEKFMQSDKYKLEDLVVDLSKVFIER